MSKINEIKEKVESGKSKIVPGLVKEAIDDGCSPQDILQGMVDSMGIVGDKFSAGDIFVPEMLISAKAMSKGVEVLKPYLIGEGQGSLGTCIIGTVEGDLHDIGKNLVSMMIESTGFKVIDLGVDVPAEKFVEALKENENVTLVALSALLTTTMPSLKETVAEIKKCNSDGFKIIVGGAPVTEDFAKEIGADGFAGDAGAGAAKAKALVQ